MDLNALNPAQRAAVVHPRGALLVLAGAGTGKTRVITYRIAHLLAQGVDPKNVLAVTFTNKAAAEMRERVKHLVGKAAKHLTLSTFHSLGARILRAEADNVGLPPNFIIYDAGEQLAIVRRIMTQIKLADRDLDMKKIRWNISAAKNMNITPETYAPGDDEYALMTAEVFPRYEHQLRALGAVDFDDLISKVVQLFERHPEVAKFYGEKWQHILVDEYQDTNPSQFAMLKAMAHHGNICAVGDDDQAIYGWRGAEVSYLLEFDRVFNDCKEVTLEQNYRSTSAILEAANAVIKNNEKRKPKKLWSADGRGDLPRVVGCTDEDDEATFVADEILQLVYDQKAKPGEVAVLYRSNVQSRAIESALRLHELKYRVIGGMQFFDRREVQDALAYLKIVDQPLDELSLRRILNTPPRGIGPTSVERIAEHAAERGISMHDAVGEAKSIVNLREAAAEAAVALHALLANARAAFAKAAEQRDSLAQCARDLFEALKLKEHIYEEFKDEQAADRRADNIEGVVNSLAHFEKRDPGVETTEVWTLSDFLAKISLSSRDDGPKDDNGDRVTLMTLHAAKGLEFKVVFLIGIEEDLLPHARCHDLAEERRLCYVGITRAREKLTMSFAKGRRKHGKVQQRTRSRFLEELPEGGAVFSDREAPEVTEEQKDAAAQDFFAKMRSLFGEGETS